MTLDPALKERIDRLVKERIALVPYNSEWPRLFEEEKQYLQATLPNECLGRIEHFGSTAVPGLSAKPIIDILVEVWSLEETKKRIVPILESEKYDYFWRPNFGDDIPPFYAWFIKRDNNSGTRTHHIHMVEPHFEHWERLHFRDYLIDHPDIRQKYQSIKEDLVAKYPNDRVAYTEGKTDFIVKITKEAMEKSKSRPILNQSSE